MDWQTNILKNHLIAKNVKSHNSMRVKGTSELRSGNFDSSGQK